MKDFLKHNAPYYLNYISAFTLFYGGLALIISVNEEQKNLPMIASIAGFSFVTCGLLTAALAAKMHFEIDECRMPQQPKLTPS